jgi:hypothetical protein
MSVIPEIPPRPAFLPSAIGSPIATAVYPGPLLAYPVPTSS